MRRFFAKRWQRWLVWFLGTLILMVISYGVGFFGLSGVLVNMIRPAGESVPVALLSDPFLQAPTPDSVRVVWFTEFAGDRHELRYGDRLQQVALAETRRIDRLREDGESQLPPSVAARMARGGDPPPVGDRGQALQALQKSWFPDRPPDHPARKTSVQWRAVWRHEAIATGLRPGQPVPYRVTSRVGWRTVTSDTFTLTATPPPGAPLQILLTSDHQLKPMTAANLQQVAATVGQVDAVWLAGDLVNVPDRASEWFDDANGGAFFPALQGRAFYTLDRSGQAIPYRGGQLIQNAPLFTAIGNHEVMGRFGRAETLNAEFNDAIPAAVAQERAGRSLDPQALGDRSFSSDTYEQLLTLPASSSGSPRYYATSFGDVRLVVLSITNAWRPPELGPNTRGRYQERAADLEQPDNWGWGQVIFGDIRPGSAQYQWLQQELASPEFQAARYRVVMFHHPPHTLGDNIVPPYTDPVPQEERDASDRLVARRYDYPIATDQIQQHLIPLLKQAGVQLVYFGHSHLWNRFRDRTPTGWIHFLESSNVGNTYGAAWGDRDRKVPPRDDPRYNRAHYQAQGDPYGLTPEWPSLIQPQNETTGTPEPFIASNDWTVFSILDTATGTVRSYRWDTRRPDQPAELFDEFSLIDRD